MLICQVGGTLGLNCAFQMKLSLWRLTRRSSVRDEGGETDLVIFTGLLRPLIPLFRFIENFG